MRREGGGSARLRSSGVARLAGAGLAVLLAAAGVTAYLIAESGSGDAPLPTQVLGTQAIGLVNVGADGVAGSSGTAPAGTSQAAGTLLASGPGLTFSTAAQAGAQWTADQMAGGTYVFIYLANGLCLASPPLAGTGTAATLRRCDLEADQRWVRQELTVSKGGTDYWQLRNLADGRCLTAGNVAGPASRAAQVEPCQAPPGSSQLVTFAVPT
jgi:hypothetical protein